MLRFIRYYAYAAWLGIALAAVGHPYTTKEYWLIIFPTIILVGLRPSEDYFEKKEEKE